MTRSPLADGRRSALMTDEPGGEACTESTPRYNIQDVSHDSSQVQPLQMSSPTARYLKGRISRLGIGSFRSEEVRSSLNRVYHRATRIAFAASPRIEEESAESAENAEVQKGGLER